jgi:hypothetical protein
VDKIKYMAAFHGIQVYEILENGNLKGIYTNRGILDDTSNTDTEIAIKKAHDNNGVEGLYDCTYNESYKNSVTHCELVISKHNNVYVFTWRDNQSNPIWEGLGLMAGTTHIAVSYDEA